MPTRAEQLRHHRKCFEYGLQRGITPREADLELKLQAARDRARTLQNRMAEKHRAECVGRAAARREAIALPAILAAGGIALVALAAMLEN